MSEHDAAPQVESELSERVRGAIHALRELAIGVASGVVDERDLAGPACGEVALYEVMRGVVVARNVDERRGDAMIRGTESRHCSSMLV